VRDRPPPDATVKAQVVHRRGGTMSNHYSAANLRFPGDDARLDFTDLYAFQEPGDSGKTILIMNANPYTTGAATCWAPTR
jgi:hypothetical protein